VSEKLLTPKEAAKMLGVHPLTLYRWAKKGKIKCIRTPSGRYRYPLKEILRILGKSESDVDVASVAVIYVRVPSERYMKSRLLEKQINELKKFARKKNLEIREIIMDISHGFCGKSPGIERLLELAKERKIGKVLIYSPETLSRLCYWLFERIFEIFGIEIITLRKSSKESSELVYLELLEIIYETLQKTEKKIR